jgi:ComF family protein
LVDLVYPPRCLSCGGMVETPGGLCGPCWRDTLFLRGLVCDGCGIALPGEEGGTAELCDECMTVARPWVHGRAALDYSGTGRKLVLALKHGDRHDIAAPAARWMLRAAAAVLRDRMLVVPVPLHWTRLARRKFNQSALLAERIARFGGHDYCPDLLWRTRRTPVLDGKTRDQRFATLADTILVNPRHAGRVQGRDILIVDDVMTTGATLAACADALAASRPAEISVLVLARVSKDA